MERVILIYFKKPSSSFAFIHDLENLFPESVVGAGFSTLYYNDKNGQVDMTAGATVASVEKLQKGDQVNIKWIIFPFVEKNIKSVSCFFFT